MTEPAQKLFKSEALEAIHASATALAKAGAISEAMMSGFDETCLLDPEQHPTSENNHAQES